MGREFKARPTVNGSGLILPADAVAGPDADITYDAAGAAGTSGTFSRSGHGHKATRGTAIAVTTPLALSAAGTSGHGHASDDHAHQSPGGIAGIVANSSAISNTEAVVVSATLPANFMLAGTTFRLTAWGTTTTSTGPGSGIFRVRIGTTTLTGNIAATDTAAQVASVTAAPFKLEALVTIRTNGASGSALGSMQATSQGTTNAFTTNNPMNLVTATVAVDTTAQKLLELTAISGASTASFTFYVATIEVVKM